MTAAAEIIVLCEGYHDRAFWKGWLLHAGCVDPGKKGGLRIPVTAPNGQQVKGGQFAFVSGTNRFIRLVPCDGGENVLKRSRFYFEEGKSKPIQRLVFTLDADKQPAETIRQRVAEEVRRSGVSAVPTEEGDLALGGGATLVSTLIWQVEAPTRDGVPGQQSLERVVCTALADVYATRATEVAHWLGSRSTPPPVSPKDHLWSYMAGWGAELGCEAFLSELWTDPPVAQRLQELLDASGALRILKAVAA
jgi:hypothetical protein